MPGPVFREGRGFPFFLANCGTDGRQEYAALYYHCTTCAQKGNEMLRASKTPKYDPQRPPPRNARLLAPARHRPAGRRRPPTSPALGRSGSALFERRGVLARGTASARWRETPTRASPSLACPPRRAGVTHHRTYRVRGVWPQWRRRPLRMGRAGLRVAPRTAPRATPEHLGRLLLDQTAPAGIFPRPFQPTVRSPRPVHPSST